jgi:hypothetical protein
MSSSSNPPSFSCRQLLSAAVLLAIGTGAIFHELVIHPNDLLVGVHADGRNDLTTAFLRYRDESFSLSAQHGEFADWNPHIQMGVPIHGNAQAGLFYPPNWLVSLLGAERSLSWMMVGHMWWAALGSFVLLRHLRLGFCAAVFGGVVTAGAPYAVAHLAEGHYAQICVFAWLPWICWRFERFLASDGRHWKLLSILVAITFFAGHVQELYYLMLLLTGCVICRCIRGRRSQENQNAKSLLIHWCLMAAVSGALVAIDLIPILLNNQATARSGKLPIELSGNGLTLAHLKMLVHPMSFGGPENLDAPEGFYWKNLVYFGVINLALAIVAILTLKSSKHTARSRWLWMAVVAVAFAFGKNSPMFQAAYHGVPMIGSFRVPARVLFIVSLMLAWLAALQIDACSRRKSATPEDAGTSSKLGLALSVTLTLLALGELAWHANRVLATISPQGWRNDSSVVDSISGDANSPASRKYERVMAVQSTLSDIEAFHSRAYRVRGYEPVLQKRYALIVDALFKRGGVKADFGGFNEVPLDRLEPSLLDLLGVRYFVSSQKQEDVEGWRLIRQGSISSPTTLRDKDPKPIKFRIYENENPLPRAFVVGDAIKNSSPNDIEKTIEQLLSVDCRQNILLDRDVLPSSGPRSKFQPAEITKYTANTVTIQVETESPGYLVLTDMFHPGWRAEVNGEAVQIEPAYIAFRAVPLEKSGPHEIVFRYQTPGRRNGAILSLAVVLLLIFAVLKRPTEVSDLTVKT